MPVPDLSTAARNAGLWVDTTLADALREVAATTPRRELVVDGDARLDAATLQRQATTLANALLARMPVGSVVSFMLPNWHEAAVVYLGATLAGMAVRGGLRCAFLAINSQTRRADMGAGSTRWKVIPLHSSISASLQAALTT